MSKAKIFYFTLRDEQRKEEKLNWFRNTRFQDIPFERITPDEHGNWINLADTDFKTLLPLANKQTKLAKTKAQENAVFKLFSLGVSTNRDEWVYDYDKKTLEAKIKYFAKVFNQESKRFRGKDVTKIGNELSNAIKSSSSLKANLVSGKEFQFEKDRLVKALYRPFFKQFFYAEQIINDRLTVNHIQMFGEKFDKENKVIIITTGNRLPFSVFSSNTLPNLATFSLDPAQTFPLYRYSESGERVENITDWGLKQFRARYEPSPQPSPSGRGSESASLSSGRGSESASLSSGRGRESASLSSGRGRESASLSSGRGSESASLSSGSMPSPQPSPDGRGSVGSESPLPVGEDLGEGRVGKGRKPKLPEALLRAARELRRNATDAEKYLWSLLRNRQLAGYKFRRQHPLGRFVLDFYCHEAKLCVELDGGQHAETAQAEYDRERTAWLNQEGIRVIRFWNTDVLNNIEGVLQSILIALTTPVEQEVKRRITKEDIFHYVYAVLHNPAYRKKYELDLKRELPRVPFYDDFWKWAAWGKRLMELHLNYESAKPFGLKRVDVVNIPSPQPSPSGRGSESASLSSGRGSESASLSSGRGRESASLSSGRGSESASLSSGRGSESASLSSGRGRESASLSSGRGSESASLSSGRGSESASLSSGRGSESASLSSGRGSNGSDGSRSESPLPVGEDLGEGREREEQMRVKVRLKADKARGVIEIDEQTTLSGVPKEAWEYKLGNRSALEWILDQYKETKPKDRTIAERFHTYRFADYKERVIDLLQRVCTVSVETMNIVREMERAQQKKP
jgi:very-short-patch-repair endonuclease